ncbi:MAG: phosphoglucosamine mutase [Calditrichaeota bacterium]|nr:MAG: phosphoglucosamine mutase [Calditrichota bacterium]
MKKEQLVKSTSGVRGVLGNGLAMHMLAEYAAAFGTMVKKGKVVVGRDSRPSGAIIKPIIISTLQSVGIDVIDIDVVPTPTVEIAVKKLKASGGICITASHNPGQWNALKFFNHTGEFITPAEYTKLTKIFESQKFAYKPFDKLGKAETQSHWIDEHIKQTLKVKSVNRNMVAKRKFKVVVDAVNGAGSQALPELLKRMNVNVIEINCKGDGNFVHEPEPIPKNLKQLSAAVKKHKADLGMACDPDADRLALVDETGKPIGEELTLTIGVMAVLMKLKGNTVINLSTSKVTADIAKSLGSKVIYSKVGESNVVQMMRQKNGVIGGEGNGGVIFPSFHAGRDSLIAAALTLTLLANRKLSLSKLVETFPKYYNIKDKEILTDRAKFQKQLEKFEKDSVSFFGKSKIDRRDGLRFDFKEGWLQLRTSNTEPIYRLIVETNEQKLTVDLADKVKKYFK